MISKLIRAIFGSKNDRQLKTMSKLVKKINQFEPDMQALSDAEVKKANGGIKVTSAAGGLKLQEHGQDVRYRNVWIIDQAK